jgi:hypothetical protein
MAPWLASHRDVNAIDLTGVADTDIAWAELERAAADNLKRVRRPLIVDGSAVEPDWTLSPGLSRIESYLETKTVWHPKGK